MVCLFTLDSGISFANQ